jgi:hypothetical protein
MDSTTFIPMYDLEHLGENQKAIYYRDACNFLGIPANLNLLAYIEMVVGDSGRHLVLYAKKGATDLIRQNRGISTTSLEAIKDLVPGQVCFIAVGKDTIGREERAVGTADIDGLRGKALSDAIMIAQTRATRRMTLQFVGGGILDESELPSNSTSLTNNTALDAITTQPVVLPNSVPSVVEPPVVLFSTAPPIIENWGDPTLTQKAAQAVLVSVKPEVLASAADGRGMIDAEKLQKTETFKNIKDLAAALPADNPLVQAAAIESPKQRKRKQVGLTLNTPQQEAQPQEVTPAPAQASTATPAPIQVAQTPVENLPVTLPAQPVQPPKIEKLLNPEEEKAIKERLAKYRNEILPTGGMVPVDKIGGIEIQLRKFVGKFSIEKPSSKTWNYTDWLKFVDFLDDVTKTRGAAGLVKYMQQVIGIVQ